MCAPFGIRKARKADPGTVVGQLATQLEGMKADAASPSSCTSKLAKLRTNVYFENMVFVNVLKHVFDFPPLNSMIYGPMMLPHLQLNAMLHQQNFATSWPLRRLLNK